MSNENVFYITADTHGSRLAVPRFTAMTGDSSAAIDSLIDAANAEDADIILAGDILDVGTTGAVSYGLTLFGGFHNKIYYVTGNHDDPGTTAGYQNPPWFWTHQSFRHLANVPSTVCGLSVVGVDYERNPELGMEKVRSVVKTFKPDVLVLHGSFDQLTPARSSLFKMSELDGLARLIIIGDTHIPFVWKTERTTFLSPGATVRQRISDVIPTTTGRAAPSSVCFWRAEVTPERIDLLKIPIPDHAQRPTYLFQLHDLSDLQRALDTVRADTAVHPANRRDELRRPLVFLRGVEGLAAEARFREELPDAFVEFETLRSEEDTLRLSVPFAATEDGKNLGDSVIAEYAAADGHPYIGEALHGILEGPAHPADVLTGIVNRILDGKEPANEQV